MADLDISSNLGHVDKRVGRGTTATTDQNSEYANMATIASLKARLTTLAGATYTAARMNSMTENDLRYALRLISDGAGI